MRMCPTRVATVLATIVLALTLATAPGCFGKAARNQAVAVLDLTNEGVNFDIQLGIQALAAASSESEVLFDADSAMTNFTVFNDAIESRDRERIELEAIPFWPMMRGFAEAGIAKQIADGTLSEANAIPVTERLAEFERLLLQMSDGLVLPE